MIRSTPLDLRGEPPIDPDDRALEAKVLGLTTEADDARLRELSASADGAARVRAHEPLAADARERLVDRLLEIEAEEAPAPQQRARWFSRPAPWSGLSLGAAAMAAMLFTTRAPQLADYGAPEQVIAQMCPGRRGACESWILRPASASKGEIEVRAYLVSATGRVDITSQIESTDVHPSGVVQVQLREGRDEEGGRLTFVLGRRPWFADFSDVAEGCLDDPSDNDCRVLVVR